MGSPKIMKCHGLVFTTVAWLLLYQASQVELLPPPSPSFIGFPTIYLAMLLSLYSAVPDVMVMFKTLLRAYE